MTADLERERRALRVFETVLEMPRAEWGARLDELCGGDGELRERVVALLDQSGAEDLRLATDFHALDDLFADARVEVSGAIGGYEIVRAIGRGGMGEVFEARQRDPARTVAIKVLRQGLHSAEARRRFADEARLLAHLRHPAIAQVIEAGVHTEVTATGPRELPFLVLEFVEDARSLVEFAQTEGLSLSQRMRLLVEIAGAVQHGHQKGVIHRDLKPANLLVGHDGRPKVIDFGVARVAADGELERRTLMTQAGQIVGTLGYIAPEALAGEVEFADVRADVYALGAVAYQLVIGSLPFELGDVSLAEAARRVTATAPIRPRERRPELDADLEAVLLQAVAREPADRYASAQAFAEDLERWLRHDPVQASRPSALRRLRLFARRDPALAGAIATIGLLVVGALLGFGVFQSNARAESDGLRRVAERNAYVSSVLAVNAMVSTGEIRQARDTLEAAPPAYRAWEWRYLTKTLDSSERTLRPFPDVAGSQGNLDDCDLDASGTRVIAGSVHGEVRSVRLADGQVIGSWDVGGDARFARFVGASGRVLLAGHQGGACRLLDTETGKAELLYGSSEGSINAIAVSRDGAVGACATSGGHTGGGEVLVFDLATGGIAHRLGAKGAVYVSVALAGNGRFLFAGTFRGELQRWDLEAVGEPEGRLVKAERFARHDNMLSDLAVSPSGDRIAAAGGRNLSVWAVESLELQALMRVNVAALAWSADGGRLVVAQRGTPSIGIMRIAEGPADFESRGFGHEAEISALRVDPAGERIVSCSRDGTVREWRADRPSAHQVLRGHPKAVRAAAATFDGARLVSGSSDGTVIVWDHDSGEQLATLDAKGRVRNIAPHPTEDLFVVAGEYLFLMSSGRPALRRVADPDAAEVGDVGWRPDGAVFVTADGAGVITLWSREGEKLVERTVEDSGGFRCLAFDASGQRLLTGSISGRLQEWSGSDLSPLQEIGVGNDFRDVGYVPGDNGAVVSTSIELDLTLWQPQMDGSHAAHVLDRGRLLQRIRFHPTEPRMFTCSVKGRLSIWDTQQWQRLLTITAHGSMALGLEFLPATDELITTSMDRTVKIWRTAP